MQKKLIIFLLFLFVLSFNNDSIIQTDATIVGDSPPGSGDWFINQDTLIDGETITIYGSIYVSANLTIINSVIQFADMESEFDVQYGRLNITNSIFKCASGFESYGYGMNIRSGPVYIRNSTFYDVGNMETPYYYNKFFIQSYDVQIHNVTIYGKYIGMMILQTSNVVVTETVVYSKYQALDIYLSHNITLDECMFYGQSELVSQIGSSYDIVIKNSNFTGTAPTIWDNKKSSIFQHTTNLTIQDCNFINAPLRSYNLSLSSFIGTSFDHSTYYDSSSKNISMFDVVSVGCDEAFLFSNTQAFNFSYSLIYGQFSGIHVKSGDSFRIFNNTLNVKGIGVYLEDSTNGIVVNNTITSTAYGVHVFSFDPTKLNHEIHNNTLNGLPSYFYQNVNNLIFNGITAGEFEFVLSTNITIINSHINGSITVMASQYFTIVNNILYTNGSGLFILGISASNYDHNISGNALNGHNIYYYYNKTDISLVNANASEIFFAGCDNVSIYDTTITNNVFVIMTNNSKFDNLVVDTTYGYGFVYLYCFNITLSHTNVRGGRINLVLMSSRNIDVSNATLLAPTEIFSIFCQDSINISLIDIQINAGNRVGISLNSCNLTTIENVNINSTSRDESFYAVGSYQLILNNVDIWGGRTAFQNSGVSMFSVNITSFNGIGIYSYISDIYLNKSIVISERYSALYIYMGNFIVINSKFISGQQMYIDSCDTLSIIYSSFQMNYSGNDYYNEDYAINIYRISNLKFTDNVIISDSEGLKLDSIQNYIFKRNNITAKLYGIDIFMAHEGVLENIISVVKNNFSISIYSAQNTSVFNSSFTSTRGIVARFDVCTNVSFYDNYVFGSLAAKGIVASTDITFTNNYISVNGTAVLLDNYFSGVAMGNKVNGSIGFKLQSNEFVNVSQNNITAKTIGIYLTNKENNSVIHNNYVVLDTTTRYAMYINGTNVEIYNNVFEGSGIYAIYFGKVAHNVSFYANIIRGSWSVWAYDGNYQYNHWNSSFTGNLWDNYNGWDNDSDGFGDTPYQIEGGGFDYLPIFPDDDHDNLSNYRESFIYNTNPKSNDTDNDGLSDWEELEVYGTEATNADTDGDGLTDYYEVLHGLNPKSADTDNDGMPDGWELTNGLNATNAADAGLDNDNDGLTNLEEYKNGTDPNNSDTDGDGIPDGWEVQNNLDPLYNDSGNDPDGDGLTNLEEYQHSTNPHAADTDNDGMPDGWEVQ